MVHLLCTFDFKNTTKKMKFKKLAFLACYVHPRQKGLGSPEIILNLVYGTETMTEKSIQKFWRLFGEIISVQK